MRDLHPRHAACNTAVLAAELIGESGVTDGCCPHFILFDREANMLLFLGHVVGGGCWSCPSDSRASTERVTAITKPPKVGRVSTAVVRGQTSSEMDGRPPCRPGLRISFPRLATDVTSWNFKWIVASSRRAGKWKTAAYRKTWHARQVPPLHETDLEFVALLVGHGHMLGAGDGLEPPTFWL
jgi:hypothetical protein